MDHKKLKKRLHAFYDGEVPAFERQEIVSHLEACAECRQAHADLKRISEIFFPKDTASLSADFTAGVMNRLEEKGGCARVTRVPARWFVPAMGAAAMLLLAVLPSPHIYVSDLIMPGAAADDATRWMFSGESPRTDDILSFVMERP